MGDMKVNRSSRCYRPTTPTQRHSEDVFNTDNEEDIQTQGEKVNYIFAISVYTNMLQNKVELENLDP